MVVPPRAAALPSVTAPFPKTLILFPERKKLPQPTAYNPPPKTLAPALEKRIFPEMTESESDTRGQLRKAMPPPKRFGGGLEFDRIPLFATETSVRDIEESDTPIPPPIIARHPLTRRLERETL